MVRLVEGCGALMKALRGDGAALSGNELEYDVLDRMERGLPRGLIAEALQPIQGKRLQKFIVKRSEDRREYCLCREDQTFILFARVSKVARQVEIFTDDPTEIGSRFDPDRPAFTLMCSDSNTQWRLHQNRCDLCRHAPQASSCDCGGSGRLLLSVQQSSVHTGEAVRHRMTAHVCCPLTGTTRKYTTKEPTRFETYAGMGLNFEDVKVFPSAKNFQLMLHENGAPTVVCRHAKVSQDEFRLDYKDPVSALQAFGLSLSTLFWV